MPAQPRMTMVDWSSLALLSILWGGSFFFSKIAVQDLPPLTVVLARVGLAAGALWLYVCSRGLPIPRVRAAWWAFAGMGALNNLIPFSLLVWSQTVISSGLASILNATTPVFSIGLAHILTSDEKISRSKLAGILLALAGVAVLMGMEAVTGAGPSWLAVLACLGAALSYGMANVFGRRFRRMGISPAASALGQLTATTAMMCPIAMVIDAPWRLAPPGAAVWIALIGLALLSTALAYIVFFRLLSTAGATNTSLVTLLIPVSAILLGSTVLDERLSAYQICGMALIGLGLVAIDGRARLPGLGPPSPRRSGGGSC